MFDELDAVLTPTPVADGRFTLEVPVGWAQGRGAFGGLLVGALVRAMQGSEPDATRRVRSVSAEIVGPVVPGACAIAVELLRRGSGVSTLSATLRQGEEVLARASAVLGRPRPVDRRFVHAVAPVAPPSADVVPMPAHLPGVPEFSQHFEYRLTGPMPFSGHATPEAAGWIRPRCARAPLREAELAAIADAWWPAAYSSEPSPRPIATVAYTMQCLIGERELPADRPLLHRARAIAAHEGFCVELRELWTEHGELVALNQQTFVWIK